MTVRTRRQPRAKPNDPRFPWPASTMAPPPLPARTGPWARGHLQRDADGDLYGELRGPDVWVLTLVGHAPEPDVLALLVTVGAEGLLLPAPDDRGLSGDLTEHLARAWPLRLVTVDGGASWLGDVVGPSWRLGVAGTRTGVGRMALAATVESARAEGSAKP